MYVHRATTYRELVANMLYNFIALRALVLTFARTHNICNSWDLVLRRRWCLAGSWGRSPRPVGQEATQVHIMSMASGLVQHVLEMLLVLGTRPNGDILLYRWCNILGFVGKTMTKWPCKLKPQRKEWRRLAISIQWDENWRRLVRVCAAESFYLHVLRLLLLTTKKKTAFHSHYSRN